MTEVWSDVVDVVDEDMVSEELWAESCRVLICVVNEAIVCLMRSLI